MNHLKQCLAYSKHYINVSYYYYGVKTSGTRKGELEILLSPKPLFNQGIIVGFPVYPSVLYIIVKGNVGY